jgi:hypothetical protein
MRTDVIPPTDLIRDGRWETETLDTESARTGWWQRWDALNASGSDAHPLLDSRFAEAVERHLADHPVRHVCYRSGGEEIAMALVCRTSPLTWALLQPSQAPLPQLVSRAGLADPDTALERIMTAGSLLPQALNIARYDPRYLALEESGEHPCLDCTRIETTIAVEANDFGRYWASRPKSLKRSIERGFRRLDAESLEARFEKVSTARAISLAVDEYGLLESQGWKEAAGTAVHPQNAQGRFYREVLERFAQRGDGYVYRLWIGQQLAAMRLVIAGNGMAVILKTTYAESLAAFGPGRLLLYHVLRDLIGDPKIKRIEFYTNANRDTLAWATESQDMYAAIRYRSAVAKRAVDRARALRDALNTPIVLRRSAT